MLRSTLPIIVNRKLSATIAAIKATPIKFPIWAGLLALSNFASSAIAAENFTNIKISGLETQHNQSTLTLTQAQQAALAGDSRAQFIIGHAYLNGKNIEQDQLRGLKWIQKAADQGLAVAQYQLGLIYEYGQGIPANQQLAAQWHLKAAEQGNIGAQHSIGIMYLEGKGIEKNIVNAYAWLALAYDNGYQDIKIIRDQVAMQLNDNQQLQAQVRMQAFINKARMSGQIAAAL